MNAFLHFFETLPTALKVGWVVLILSVFWIAEGYYSFVKFKYKKWQHAKTNFILLGFVFLINFLFGLFTLGIFKWLDTNNFGILHLIELPTVVELFLAILVLDFIAQYLVHYLLHKVPLFFRLHIVHHSDLNVDATTGTRHHPLDFLLRETFALVAVIIMGMPISYYLFYRILSVFFTYFTHANIRLPSKFDKALSYVFITPTVHKFHHHWELPWTDSNFGNMFSIWDRLFGTFVYADPSKIKYGLDILDHTTSNTITYQLYAPFNKHIKYKNKS